MTWMIFSYFDDKLWSIMQATKVSDFTAEHEKHILELHETYAWISSGKVIATEISAITGEKYFELDELPLMWYWQSVIWVHHRVTF